MSSRASDLCYARLRDSERVRDRGNLDALATGLYYRLAPGSPDRLQFALEFEESRVEVSEFVQGLRHTHRFAVFPPVR